MITASNLPRALACPGSQLLPHSDATNGAASRGTAIHAYLASCVDHPRELALQWVPEEFRAECEAIDLGEVLPDMAGRRALAEAAYRYDVGRDVGTFLGQHLGRDYPSPRGKGPYLCGTADLVIVAADHVHVLDYKTGQQDGTPGAEENLQLQAYALMAARAHGVDRARVTLVFVDGARVEMDSAELDSLQLDAASALVREIFARVDGTQGSSKKGAIPTREGPHCRYCPAFTSCPSKLGLAASLARGEGFDLRVLDATSAPRVLSRLEACEEILARVRRAVEEYAEAAPIECPDGTLFGPVPVTRESLDGWQGYDVLAQRFGEKVARAAVETKKSLTKASLTAALREHAQVAGQRLSELEAAALEALRANGASKSKTTLTLRHYRAHAQSTHPLERK